MGPTSRESTQKGGPLGGGGSTRKDNLDETTREDCSVL